ncbi:MAG: ATP-binding cassette domain-containing protein [Alphaproteobacteria bacterium]|nr:MAG: ATP-binding cassette domain-containing protein [Alphaproteobacteria bacterium]
MALLEVRSLARPPLLGPVSFTLDAGTCLGIEGPSGSGKSTLLRALADLDPARGEVFLNGTARNSMPAAAWRARVCYVAAEPAWWAERVGDHFADEERGARLAEALGLAGAMDWTVTRLSTGEGQRLGLARALAGKPAVLLLDEPTSGLDRDAARRVARALERLLEDGGSVVLVAHDPALLDSLAARRLRMANGRLEAAA